jgi:hypothetical protein
MRIVYETKRFSADTLQTIQQANEILEEYAQQGFDLTLRQLYYQFVARGLIPNVERSYKRLGSIVNDARMAGYIDWDLLVDRTRNVRMLQHWDDPAHIIRATARSFKVDLWAKQGDYVEVWIEKDALVGVIAGVSEELDVPYFSCRGYTSQSEMWGASQRLLEQMLAGKRITIIHLGDHDPSGIDMTRDIEDRLRIFIATDYITRHADELDGWDDLSDLNQDLTMRQWGNEVLDRLEIRRIALNMDQINQYNPPPNPAKMSDSRAHGYVQEYGDKSWELDALPPDVLSNLVRTSVEALIDSDAWDAEIEREQDGQRLLALASQRWEAIVESLNGSEPDTEENA